MISRGGADTRVSRLRSLRSGRGFLTIGVAGAVLVGSLAVLFGAPAHSQLLSLLSGHGWLTTDRPGQVMLANGQTGKLDFRMTLPTTGDPLDVVQSGKNALLIDGKTGVAGSIDIGNLKVVDLHRATGSTGGSLGTASSTTSPNQVLPAPGGKFYIVHRTSGRISVTDPVIGKTVATKSLGGRLSPAVVDRSDSLWTENVGAGTMVGATFRSGSLRVDQVKNSVVAPGDAVTLSAVNGTPAVLDHSRGLFFMAPAGVPGAAVSLPSTVASRAAISPILNGPVVPLAASGKVVLIENGAANVVDLNGLSGNRLGAPIPFAQRVYVPDLSNGSVVVLDDAGQQVGAPIQVSAHAAPLSVNVQNGALFINNPDSNTAYSVGADGRVIPIVKNDPNVPTNQAPPPSTTTTTTTPPPVVPPLTLPTPATPTPGAGPVSATPAPTIPASVPAAPGSPSAQAGNQSATVTWTPPTAHGSPVTGYTVKWTAGGGGTKAVGGNTTTAQITGLKNGTAYSFDVTATNAIGTGPAAKTTAVTPTTAIPSAPTTVTAKANKDGSISVSWTKANGQGHAIAGYSVTATPTSGSALAPVTVTSGTSVTFKEPQLVLGTSYTFTVKATNNVGGTSKASSPSAAVTASTVPFAVSGLAATANGKGTVAVSWTCGSTCAGGSPLTKFIVALTPAVGSAVTVPAVNGQAKYSTTLSGLADKTNYSISVTATNAAWGAGQSATAGVLTEGQPTATVSPSWNGLSLTLTISVNSNGATVTGCGASLSGPGGTLSASGGCTSLSMSAPYYDGTYSGSVTVAAAGFGTNNAANVNTTSPLKTLRATALPAYGSCPSPPVPYYENQCGASSRSYSTSTPTINKTYQTVSAPQTVEASCYTTNGKTINNGYSAASPGTPVHWTLSSRLWVKIPAMGSYPWMNSLYFSPYTTVQNNLQHC